MTTRQIIIATIAGAIALFLFDGAYQAITVALFICLSPWLSGQNNVRLIFAPFHSISPHFKTKQSP